jgi:hypothetical protein
MAKKSIREMRLAGRQKDNSGFSTDTLFNFDKDSYLERTSRPIYAVLFLLPFIVIYEIGTIAINTDILNRSQIRVVAFVWLQRWLDSLGFAGSFAWIAPGLVVIIILLSQQITSGKQWKIWFFDFFPMIIECILMAIPLIVLTLFLNSLIVPDNAVLQNASFEIVNLASGSPAAGHSVWANIVTGIGAGIYEELVFRLILICLLMMLFQDVFKLSHTNAVMLSVFISAGLFSAHHHIDFLSGRENQADPFDWAKFAFRTMAGIYFAFLYAIRGFGITAGTHSFYNIIAESLNASFFQ